jgi:uncharacterized protein YwlG (UPF0340 family)
MDLKETGIKKGNLGILGSSSLTVDGKKVGPRQPRDLLETCIFMRSLEDED